MIIIVSIPAIQLAGSCHGPSPFFNRGFTPFLFFPFFLLLILYPGMVSLSASCLSVSRKSAFCFTMDKKR